MKRKKHHAAKNATKKNQFEVAVGKDFDISEYSTQSPGGDLTVEGYTFHIDEYNLILPACTVVFKKCKFVSGEISPGNIVTPGRLIFAGCVFRTGATFTIVANSYYDNTVIMTGCTGETVAIRRDIATATFNGTCTVNECTFKYLVVHNFSKFNTHDLAAHYLSLASINYGITISKSRLLSDYSDTSLTVLTVSNILSAPVTISGSTIQGNVNVETSTITEMDISGTDIVILSIKHTTLNRMAIDRTSRVSIINARISTCEIPSIHPACHTLTSSYASVGFPMCTPTLYKKVKLRKFLHFTDDEENVVLEMEVPPYAQARYTECSRKIRVSAAITKKIYRIVRDQKGNAKSLEPMKLPFLASLISNYNNTFKYRFDKVARPRKPFDTSANECASGIHGFLDPMEAAKY